MWKELFKEEPLYLNIELACAIGSMREALILQQIHLDISNGVGEVFNNRYWITNTYDKWQERFPFLTLHQVKKSILNLEKKKLLVSCKLNKTTWEQEKSYTINYDELNRLSKEYFDLKHSK